MGDSFRWLKRNRSSFGSAWVLGLIFLGDLFPSATNAKDGEQGSDSHVTVLDIFNLFWIYNDLKAIPREDTFGSWLWSEIRSHFSEEEIETIGNRFRYYQQQLLEGDFNSFSDALGTSGGKDLENLDAVFGFLRHIIFSDETPESNVATANIKVNAVPVDGNEVYSFSEDELSLKTVSVTPNKLDNATDADIGDVLSIGAFGAASVKLTVVGLSDDLGGFSISQTSSGVYTLVHTSSGDTATITIHPNGTEEIKDNGAIDHIPFGRQLEITINYTVQDQLGAMAAESNHIINILGVNDAPIAQVQTVSVDEDALIAGQVIATDVDDLTALTYSFVGTTVPTGLTFNTNGSFTFDADSYDHLAQGATEDVVFQYKAKDSTDDSNIATVTVQIKGLNDAPVAQDKTVAVNEDASISGQVIATDVDDLTALTYSFVGTTVPTGLTFNTNGSFTFDADSYDHLAQGATEDVVFQYKANDGTADSNTATVTVKITGVNDVPIAQDQTVSVNEDASITSQVIATDADVGDTLTYSLVGSPTNGTISFDGTTGSFTYTPNANFNGIDSFSYKVSDGNAESNEVIVILKSRYVFDWNVESTELRQLPLGGSNPSINLVNVPDYTFFADSPFINDFTSNLFNLNSIVARIVLVSPGVTVYHIDFNQPAYQYGNLDPLGFDTSGINTVDTNIFTLNVYSNAGFGTPVSYEVMLGSNTEDSTTNGSLNRIIFGLGTIDDLFGSDGNDYIDGGNGNDTLNGGLGDDYLFGSGGNDILIGGSGDDILDGSIGSDNMTGGTGNDIYFVDSAGDVVTESANQGIDTVLSSVTRTLGANVENLILMGTANINGTGNTLDNVITGNSGNNTLNGVSGNDTVSYENATSGVTVNLSTSAAQNTVGAGTDTILNFDNLGGSTFGDTLTGNNLNNTINGGASNDIINGGPGDDTLIGGINGDDTLIGGLGNDNLTGDIGNDTFVYDLGSSSIGNDTITDFNNGADVLRFDNVLDVTAGIVLDDLRALTNVVANGAFIQVNMYNDSANTTLIGSVTLNGIAYINDGLHNEITDYAAVTLQVNQA